MTDGSMQPVRWGALRASAMKGRGLDRHGRPYWRVREASSRHVLWSGRVHRDDLPRVLEELRKGSPRGPSGAVATVSELLGAWYQHQKQRAAAGHIAARTLTSYRNGTSLWMGEPIGQILVVRLQRHDVEDQILAWGTAGMAPRTGERLVHLLARAWRWGSKRGMVPELDLAKLAPRAPKGAYVYRSSTATLEQAQAMLTHIADPVVRQAVRLLMLTGCRVSEVMALEASAYDRHGRILTVTGKTGARRLPLTGELLELVAELAQAAPPGGRLLPTTRGTVARYMLRACRAAKVPEYTPHGLRRMVVSELVKRHTNLQVVARFTGHSVPVLVRDYLRPSEDEIRQAVQATGLRTRAAAGDVIELPTREREG